MRKQRLGLLLAGTALALLVGAPTTGLAAPDGIRSVAPPPAALPGRARPAAATPRNAETANRNSGTSEVKATLDKPLAAEDAPIADKLRAIVTSKQFEKRIDNASERKAIETHYAARNYAPLWIREGRPTDAAKDVIARIKIASADGLDAADYPVPEFAGVTGSDALAAADIRLTRSVLTYARHLAAGRIAPTRVAAEVDYGSRVPEPADILAKVVDAQEAGAALDSYNPPHQGYKALKAKLAELRSARAEDDNRIPDGQAIKPGEKDARVAAVREKLGIIGKPGDILYDKALVAAVKSAQTRADIKPTGVVDNRTLAAINGPKLGQRIDRVIANMERWRWLPRDLGRTYVMVNIPDYTLKVVRDDRPVWRTKIVAGRPQTPTPLLTAAMQEVIVNPSWYVPQSIIQNELLPQYASDPLIFERMGLEVKRGPDGNINVVQPPGAANALGRIKFTFPNKFQVYLHDTPEKKLFAHDRRAFSHGCMRVEDPTKFGEVMLGLTMNGPAPDSRQISAMFGEDEKKYQVQNRATVHLTYQTAFVDDAGRLVLRDDIYGLDARIRAILHSDERRVADVAPPPEPKTDLATLRSNQEMLRRVERRETAGNPFEFFERLFR